MESIEELIARLNRNTAAQLEQTERWERELGLAPLEAKEREPTELELLLQKWEQAREAPLSAVPAREAPRSPAPEDVVLCPEWEESFPESEEGQPREREVPPPATDKGEEGRSPPPPQPRPPPLRSGPALLQVIPCPLLLDTLPVCLDLPALDLELRSVHHRPQLYPWFPSPLSPITQTSLGCCQTSLLSFPWVIGHRCAGPQVKTSARCCILLFPGRRFGRPCHPSGVPCRRNLPAKPAEEAQKHRQQYEEMVAQAKKREIKEAQKRKKQLEERCKLEESIGNAAMTWNQEILPNWETMCNSRKVRELWWQGVPPSVRGKVWSLAVGNELNITHELYDICLARARAKWKSMPTAGPETDNEDPGISLADREASLELIKLDISRTFPNLCIFQKVQGMSFIAAVLILNLDTADAFIAFANLLNKPCQMAFFRVDHSLVQGMSFIAAVLILNLDTADAFIAFANLLNKPCQMAFFRVDHSLMLTYFAAFEVFFEENLPKLFEHFKKNNLTPDIYLIDWIFTLYSKSLPLDLACRVWDVFCRDGDEFLFHTALGILKLYEDILTKMDFIHNAQFLTKLPEDIPAEELFTAIAAIQMQSRNKKWAQVL
ncbi:UNVERIFIED_CONTAM: hypothetical protein FKN15_029802 [Acipenser sinensis]